MILVVVVAGTSWPERREEVQYLFEEPHPETNELVRSAATTGRPPTLEASQPTHWHG